MSREWFRLDGQVALITGAAQGIGRAVAEALAEAGARLVIADRQADKRKWRPWCCFSLPRPRRTSPGRSLK